MSIATNSLIGAFQFVGMSARGEISTEAFVRDLLFRSTQQANLNTFTWVNSDGALKAARAADRKRATGTPIGLLEGLPLVVKDNINTLGFPTSAGTRALKVFVPRLNAPVWQRLLDEGAILLAKANMHELAGGWDCRTSKWFRSRRLPCW